MDTLVDENVNKDKGRLTLPPILFGTSGLGNLFVSLDASAKRAIVKACVDLSPHPVVFDSAGKYGAGLALEVLGSSLRSLNVPPDQVIISNKLGWYRTELKTESPTFEPGIWMDLKNDAVQKISYEGILACFEQGNALLNGYIPQMVSVHDPDEYLAKAENEAHFQSLYHNVLEAYRALIGLKEAGVVKAVGVGAKNWKVIRQIAADVDLDWVMIANSMTIKQHPQDLLEFISGLHEKGVLVINSAVFHSGFLVGSNYYDYQLLNPNAPETKELYAWREAFFHLCADYNLRPATVCVQFAWKIPGVSSVALNTTAAHRVKENLEHIHADIPAAFWEKMILAGLLEPDFHRLVIPG
ncbi:MAG: aldo/keto reductase [Haliscomenobacter sp.]|nr:aldo/keto reductase [Haliscomenobacter sp.]